MVAKLLTHTERDGTIRDVKSYRTLAFWILPPLLAVAVVSPFLLTRGEGPMAERVAAIVLFLLFAAVVEWVVYRATRREAS